MQVNGSRNFYKDQLVNDIISGVCCRADTKKKILLPDRKRKNFEINTVNQESKGIYAT